MFALTGVSVDGVDGGPQDFSFLYRRSGALLCFAQVFL